METKIEITLQYRDDRGSDRQNLFLAFKKIGEELSKHGVEMDASSISPSARTIVARVPLSKLDAVKTYLSRINVRVDIDNLRMLIQPPERPVRRMNLVLARKVLAVISVIIYRGQEFLERKETTFRIPSLFLKNVAMEIERVASKHEMDLGWCICCGGRMKLTSYIHKGMPFVYLSCGNKKNDDLRCDLYNRSSGQCIVTTCAFVGGEENDERTAKRVEILFNLVRWIRSLVKKSGSCVVNRTRDSIDAVSILHAMRGISAWSLNIPEIPAPAQRYILFNNGNDPSTNITHHDPMIVDDWRGLVEKMNGGSMILPIIDKFRNRDR